MSLLYVLKSIANPQNRGAAKKYYLSAKIRGHKSHKDVITGAARNTTFNAREINLAVSAWFEEVLLGLREGFSVEVIDLGTFSVSIQSEGSDTESGATAAKKKSVSLNLRVSARVQEELNKIPLEKFKPDGTL